MAIEVKVPAMGESITSGILSSWSVQDGDIVSAGQVLYELETDKISSEGTAEAAGKISIQAQEGDEVEIGQVIASIDTAAAGDAPAAPAKSAPEAAAAEAAPAPAEPSAAAPQSPAVRRLSEETGVNPDTLAGTGKGGRVTKGDMLAASKAAPQEAPAPAATPQAAAPARVPEPMERTSIVKMTPLRQKIAERLVASQHETASLTTFNEVDMKAIMDLRKQHQEDFVAKHGIKLGFMSFFVKAVVKALQDVPALNAQLDMPNKAIVQNHFYDIGIAVGGPKGLIVPVVRGCDNLGFHEIEQSIADCAKRARDGKIGIDELQGAVFTITNGGIYGSLLSTPILNYPQSGILGMHSIQERPVVRGGEIVIRPIMNLALTYDHRIVDGKEAVTFLVKVKEALENPARLLLAF